MASLFKTLISHCVAFKKHIGYSTEFSLIYLPIILIGPFEFKVEGRSKTAGTAEGCDFWDQNGVLLLQLRVTSG